MTRVTVLSVFDRDKAGGYGIQALGGMLVEYVRGDFLNVVGFPLNHFCKQLGLIFNSPPESPAHKIKRDSDDAWTLVNSLSEGGANEAKLLENCKDGSKTSMQEQNVVSPDCAKRCGQDVPHSIISLLDGFKASKVIVIRLFQFHVMVYKKKIIIIWHYLHTLRLCLKFLY